MKTKENSRSGLVKLFSLRNKRSSLSDPRLDWIMFHKIAAMHR